MNNCLSKNYTCCFNNICIGNNELENILKGGVDKIVKNGTNILQITSTNNQRDNNYNNISTINLGKYETILKNEYHINKKLPLLILKIDRYIQGLKIPDIQYQVLHPLNKDSLDLNYYKGTFIEIEIPVSIDEDNLNKYNLYSDYYNDKCYTYT